MPGISVIIATKNEQDYIANALRQLTLSVNEAKKSGIPVELIIVDSSTDKTRGIAEKFTDKVYRVPSQGVSKARNFGARHAQNDVLVFMDADTIVQDHTLIDVASVFQEKSVASVVSYVLPLQYSELPYSARIFYAIDKMFIKACGLLSFLIRFYNRGDIVGIGKSLFNAIGGFDEELYMMEITALLVNASKKGHVRVLPNPVFESSRRLRKWGLIKSYRIWWKNYVAFHLTKRLHDAKYEVVR